MPDVGSSVLHLVDSAGMYGAERVILTLLAELEDSPFRGVLGCIREDPAVVPDIARRADDMGVETRFFTMRRGISVRGLWSLGRWIEQSGFRIAHSHGYKTDIFLGPLRRPQTKLIATVHGWPIGAMSAKLKMYRFLDTLALRRFDAVVAVSEVMGNALERRIPDRRLHVIYNGIDVTGVIDTRRAELRAALGIPANARVLGFLGRLAPVKGPEYLVDAMPALVANDHCWLLLAGEGPLRRKLEMRAQALGVLDRLRFMGYVDNIDTFLPMLDLLVMPSLSEGLPMALLEAGSRGIPIVASAVGGIPEVIQSGRNGFLVPPGDARALAETALAALRNEAATRRSAMALKETILTRFTATEMAGSYRSLYERLLANRSDLDLESQN